MLLEISFWQWSEHCIDIFKNNNNHNIGRNRERGGINSSGIGDCDDSGDERGDNR